MREKIYDAIIVGGGPAGLTAALYLARAKCSVLLIEKERLGGQISITEEVVNYPGIETISGIKLVETVKKQAESFGAEFINAEAESFKLSGDIKVIRTDRGSFKSFGVILALGAHPKKVGFKGEEEFMGRGVGYCATCDGEFFTGKEIFVVGGGYAAAEESLFLTRFAKHITILIRKDDFSCAAAIAEKARNHSKITVLTNTVLEEVSGTKGLTYARYKNVKTGETTEIRRTADESFGVFVFAGYAPSTEKLKGIVELNESGYIITDQLQKTNIKGVYAAGDVCIKPLRQVITAASDGAVAATELEKYIAVMNVENHSCDDTVKEENTISSVENVKTDVNFGIFTEDMRQQLDNVFNRMEKPLLLKLYLDDRAVSDELRQFIFELTEMTDKLNVYVDENDGERETPCVVVCSSDGNELGIAFHGVPGGHEVSSFVLGLYNASGPGQEVSEETKDKITSIDSKVNIDVFVTQSCTMCPDTVVAAQRIAVENPFVNAHVYDIRNFEKLREHYGIMSVPCIVVNKDKIYFGKKNIDDILKLI